MVGFKGTGHPGRYYRYLSRQYLRTQLWALQSQPEGEHSPFQTSLLTVNAIEHVIITSKRV